MMKLRPSLIAKAAQGTWLAQPASDAPLKGVGIDSREELHGKLFIAIRGEKLDGHDFAMSAVERGACMLMVERAVEMRTRPAGVGVLKVHNTRAALMRLARVYRESFADTKVVAVTGSSGKTTTREMIRHVLNTRFRGIASPKSFNNDIGVPLTLLAVQPGHEYAVIEVGINAVGEMQPLAELVQPDVAVITNIGDSHLEGLGDVFTVAREKLLLARALRPGGMAILPVDSPELRAAAEGIKNVVWFGTFENAQIRLVDRIGHAHGSRMTLGDGSEFHTRAPGRHNAMNALAAIAVGRHLGLTDEEINAGLGQPCELPMRMQDGTMHGIRVINDAYNANPQSMVAGVAAFLELAPEAVRRVLVLGDMCELGATGPELHRRAGEQIGRLLLPEGETEILCVGELASRHLSAGVLDAHPGIRITTSQSASAAAERVASLLEPGDAVFLKGSRAMELETILPAIKRAHLESAEVTIAPVR